MMFGLAWTVIALSYPTAAAQPLKIAFAQARGGDVWVASGSESAAIVSAIQKDGKCSAQTSTQGVVVALCGNSFLGGPAPSIVQSFGYALINSYYEAFDPNVYPVISLASVFGGRVAFYSSASPPFSLAATSSAPWLTISTGGLQYTVTNSIKPRTATLSLGGGITLTARQAAGTAYVYFNPKISADVGSDAGTGSARIRTILAAGTTEMVDAPWTVSSDQPWLTVTTPTGVGTGDITFRYTANLTTTTRVGKLTAGQVFTVTQAPGVITLTPNSASAGQGASSGGIQVTANNIPWTAQSDASWLTVSPTSGTGSATIKYAFSANQTSTTRTGTISVGTEKFVLSQAAGVVTLSRTSASVPQPAGSGGIQLTASNVEWTATTDASWLTVSPSSGTGSATLTYSFSANPTFSPRTGIISVGPTKFAVTQAGVAGTLNPETVLISQAAGHGSFALALTAVTSWTATSSAAWLTVAPTSGSGNATLQFTASPNDSVVFRTATITVAGAVFRVNQIAEIGRVELTPRAATVTEAKAIGLIQVRPYPADFSGWSVTGVPDWLNLSFSGNDIAWAASANNTGANRIARLNIAGQAFPLIQAGAGANNPVISGVTNASSYAVGSVAPGEIITLFGLSIGPAAPAGPQVGDVVSTTNNRTQVLFDGIHSPIIGTYTTQTSVQVPYSVSGATTTRVTVSRDGTVSEPVELQVSPSAVGLFSIDATGRGQAAALNQDLSINSPNNPAPRGSVIVLYATGEGSTDPPGVAGTINPLNPPWRIPVMPVSVTIGETPAVTEFVGGAPGQVSGLLQINARIATNAPTGSVRVRVQVGDPNIGASFSQEGVTISVK